MSLFSVIISHCAFSSLSRQGPGHSTEWLHKVREDCFSEGGEGGGLRPAACSLAGHDRF